MDLEIVSWTLKPTYRELGELIVRYGMLRMKCHVVLFTHDTPHLWVRMPEMWTKNRRTKISVAWWAERQISTIFQQAVLEKLNEKFGFNLLIAQEAYKKHCKKPQKGRKS